MGDRISVLWYTDPAAVADMLCATTSDHIDEQQWRDLLPTVPYVRPCP